MAERKSHQGRSLREWRRIILDVALHKKTFATGETPKPGSCAYDLWQKVSVCPRYTGQATITGGRACTCELHDNVSTYKRKKRLGTSNDQKVIQASRACHGQEAIPPGTIIRTSIELHLVVSCSHFCKQASTSGRHFREHSRAESSSSPRTSMPHGRRGLGQSPAPPNSQQFPCHPPRHQRSARLV